MKAKVILYGWVISWIFLFAGIDTIEYGNEMEGSLLCTIWFVFSLLLIGNEVECGKEVDRFVVWIDKTMARILDGGDKDNNQGLGFN